MLSALSLTAQSVFIWDNENPTFYFPDPETGYSVSGDEPITALLQTFEIPFDYGNILPSDLSQYELIFILLGSFCES
jgi:hypothetical protein